MIIFRLRDALARRLPTPAIAEFVSLLTPNSELNAALLQRAVQALFAIDRRKSHMRVLLDLLWSNPHHVNSDNTNSFTGSAADKLFANISALTNSIVFSLASGSYVMATFSSISKARNYAEIFFTGHHFKNKGFCFWAHVKISCVDMNNIGTMFLYCKRFFRPNKVSIMLSWIDRRIASAETWLEDHGRNAKKPRAEIEIETKEYDIARLEEIRTAYAKALARREAVQ